MFRDYRKNIFWGLVLRQPHHSVPLEWSQSFADSKYQKHLSSSILFSVNILWNTFLVIFTFYFYSSLLSLKFFLKTKSLSFPCYSWCPFVILSLFSSIIFKDFILYNFLQNTFQSQQWSLHFVKSCPPFLLFILWRQYSLVTPLFFLCWVLRLLLLIFFFFLL